MDDGRKLLQRWARCGENCSDAIQQLHEYQERLDRVRDIGAVQYSPVPHGTDVSQPTETKALKALEMGAEFEAQVEWLTAKVVADLEVWRLVDGVLTELPSRYREVATLRYCGGLSWLQISRTLYRSESNCRDIDARLADAVSVAYTRLKS